MLEIKRPRSEQFRKSLAYLGPKKWSRLPVEFHHAPSKQNYKLLVRNLVNSKAMDIVVNTNGAEDFNSSTPLDWYYWLTVLTLYCLVFHV